MSPGKDKLSILAFKSSISLCQGKHLQMLLYNYLHQES